MKAGTDWKPNWLQRMSLLPFVRIPLNRRNWKKKINFYKFTIKFTSCKQISTFLNIFKVCLNTGLAQKVSLRHHHCTGPVTLATHPKTRAREACLSQVNLLILNLSCQSYSARKAMEWVSFSRRTPAGLPSQRPFFFHPSGHTSQTSYLASKYGLQIALWRCFAFVVIYATISQNTANLEKL